MGVTLAAIHEDKPNLKYFDKDYMDDYEKIEFPYSADELIKIYAPASKKNKEDKEFAKIVQDFLIRLQKKEKGIYAL
jgi:hypothetical protein